jgi:hypothetical protein
MPLATIFVALCGSRRDGIAPTEILRGKIMIRDNHNGTFTVVENGVEKGTYNDFYDAANNASSNCGRTDDLDWCDLEPQDKEESNNNGFISGLLNFFGIDS